MINTAIIFNHVARICFIVKKNEAELIVFLTDNQRFRPG
jgi:hypothetical protein